MFCKKCGYNLKATEQFCPVCGTKNALAGVIIDSAPPRKNKKWLLGVIAVCVACVLVVLSIGGIISRHSTAGSPENAIEAYYQLLAEGDFEGMVDLIPEEKQEILLDAINDAYGDYYDYDSIDDAFEDYGEWFENHTGRVRNRYDDDDGYSDYGDSVWEEMVPGLDDYEIYKCGSVSVKVKDENKADLIDLLQANWDFDEFRDEDDLLEEIEDAGEVEDFDSEDVIDFLSYDKLVECKTTIKPESGSSLTQDVYVYKIGGKWYCANVLLYFCYYLMEA